MFPNTDKWSTGSPGSPEARGAGHIKELDSVRLAMSRFQQTRLLFHLRFFLHCKSYLSQLWAPPLFWSLPPCGVPESYRTT